MKTPIQKISYGSYGNIREVLYRSKWMVLLYSLLIYLTSDVLLNILLRTILTKYFSFLVFFIAYFPAIILEHLFLRRIYYVTNKRRICIYLLVILYSIIHGLISISGNVDISAYVIPIFRTIIFGIISFLMIIAIQFLQKNSKDL